MARLDIQNPETATGTNKTNFDAFKKALGTVPNMMKVMGNSPALLQAYAQFSGSLSQGKLPAQIREQIALLSAETNECDYCLAAHTAIGGMVGLKPDAIQNARNARAADPKAAAALDFARKVLSTRGGVSEDDINAARHAGLTDDQIAQVVGEVALNVLTNYFNRAFAVDVDFPRVSNFETAGR